MKYKPVLPVPPRLTELERTNILLGQYAVNDHHAVCGKDVRLQRCPYKKTHWHEAKQRMQKLIKAAKDV